MYVNVLLYLVTVACRHHRAFGVCFFRCHFAMENICRTCKHTDTDGTHYILFIVQVDENYEIVEDESTLQEIIIHNGRNKPLDSTTTITSEITNLLIFFPYNDRKYLIQYKKFQPVASVPYERENTPMNSPSCDLFRFLGA